MYKDSLLHIPSTFEEQIKDDLIIEIPQFGKYDVITEEDLRTAQLYYKDGNDIVVPRNYIVKGLDYSQVEDRTMWNNPRKIKFDGELFEHQKNALNLIKETNNIIIEMPTGTGKTVLGIAALAYFGRRTLILTHKLALAKQWKERIIQFTGNVPGLLCGGLEEISEIRNVVIATPQTIISKIERVISPRQLDNQTKFFNSFDVIIVDEAHRFGAVTFSRAISYFPARIRVGLTATAFRSDALANVFSYHIGSVHKVRADNLLQPVVYMVRTPYFEKAKIILNTYARDIPWLLNTLSKDRYRNAFIMKYIYGSVKSGRQTLILTARIKHARYMYLNLRKKFLDTNILLFIGETAKNSIDKINDAQVIVATYGVAKEGIDIPRLETMFLALPISGKLGVIQCIGRLTRNVIKKQPIVIDFVDSTGVCNAMGKRRMQIYNELGLVVHDLRHRERLTLLKEPPNQADGVLNVGDEEE